MTAAQATAEVFWMAFQALPEQERQEFLHRLVTDAGLREDLVDALLIEERRHEPARPAEEVLAE